MGPKDVPYAYGKIYLHASSISSTTSLPSSLSLDGGDNSDLTNDHDVFVSTKCRQPPNFGTPTRDLENILLQGPRARDVSRFRIIAECDATPSIPQVALPTVSNLDTGPQLPAAPQSAGSASPYPTRRPTLAPTLAPKKQTGDHTPTRRMLVVVLCLRAVRTSGEHPDFYAVSDVLVIIFNLAFVLMYEAVRMYF
ncbi:hypothetical protein SCLCIDRAFT_27361 [Scleroderma citrinum Foug A]|uniref:Uncharacterized protein n=1 Tax=Scleroderma citrinum Foug A TaxID=1036808 RepID=A0A0C2ZC36_9AGAM|nr:hypothetical protein SCLCIDRAFT_27361 [Scleroderma citrinum Foug A]